MPDFFGVVLRWFKSLFIRKGRKVEHIHVEYTPKQYNDVVTSFNPTKAYYDQRQKAPHNRRRKPSKKMRRLYHL